MEKSLEASPEIPKLQTHHITEDFFDYVGDYCSVKIIKDRQELDKLKDALIQKNYVYSNNLVIDKETGEIVSCL